MSDTGLRMAVPMARRAFRACADAYRREGGGAAALASAADRLGGEREGEDDDEGEREDGGGGKGGIGVYRRDDDDGDGGGSDSAAAIPPPPPPPPPLTGLALLYGPSGSMPPHFDSPTQPGRAEEWLTMFRVGCDVLFRLGDEVLIVGDGDAVVMDSMSVLHGVESVVAPLRTSKIVGEEGKEEEEEEEEEDLAIRAGLPIPGN